METMSADEQFFMEYRLLEIYHKRKSRSSTKSKYTIVSPGPALQSRQPFRAAKINDGHPVLFSAKTDAFDQVAAKLTDIVDSVPPTQDQVETDSGSGVIQRLVELLKEYGDQVNEKIQNDEQLLRHLQGSFSYNLFEKLASAFIQSIVPQGKAEERQREEVDQKIKIAWTFEMTSRLSTLDLQPMNRAMGFGAKYVHQHFAPWIQQHGGWENAFKIHDDDEVQ
ncbi:apoptosis facilitator Bcl-2-like protein 14 [Neoarius graeffei]|uniref:apoptosis facilitator Bcl-2-like protein 14 n=1 Tax=Neoarius graeffei TaxID=443677 RepID=UPI00298D52E3|nr:apoptosis facilitator Bcl-2-like protein 14 [Neoarius graeffei]